jgi:hypothetical protein
LGNHTTASSIATLIDSPTVNTDTPLVMFEFGYISPITPAYRNDPVALRQLPAAKCRYGSSSASTVTGWRGS